MVPLFCYSLYCGLFSGICFLFSVICCSLPVICYLLLVDISFCGQSYVACVCYMLSFLCFSLQFSLICFIDVVFANLPEHCIHMSVVCLFFMHVSVVADISVFSLIHAMFVSRNSSSIILPVYESPTASVIY